MKFKKFIHDQPFQLESGSILNNLEITFTTYGHFEKGKSKVVWVCHALTANSDPEDWWHGLVGNEKLIDPEKYFIVCVNMLGSCYGTTGPSSLHPDSKHYGLNFPTITIRDMIKCHEIIADYLEIDQIYFALGGSMGGQQVLEWSISNPKRFSHICLLACNAYHSPWGVAYNEAQRMAILADSSINDKTESAGAKGMEAARAVAMLSYRHYISYGRTQSDNPEKIDKFKASSYQRYQGLKLSKRFDARSYISLSKSMDSHNIGRSRGGIEKALSKVTSKTLIIGISTDNLFPIEEQELISQGISGSQLTIIESDFGHDGFLIEFEKIESLISEFLG